MPTPDQVEKTVASYVDAIQRKDREAFLELFTADAVSRDPVPAPENIGPDGLAAWWDGMVSVMEKISFDVHDLHVCGDQAAMVWTTNATPPGGGGTVHINGVDIFTVTDDGKISSMLAYWDPSKVTAD